MTLVHPDHRHVESYLAALHRGWSPDTRRDTSAEVVAEVEADEGAFLAGLDDREPAGRFFTLLNGGQVPRLPSFSRWMWDGAFCGQISLRWQLGTTALPPTCPGHVGYAVVPWKRRLGHAGAALASLLPEARDVGLPHVDVTTDPDNIASQKVITGNGGELVELFTKPLELGGGQGLRYRIQL